MLSIVTIETHRSILADDSHSSARPRLPCSSDLFVSLLVSSMVTWSRTIRTPPRCNSIIHLTICSRLSARRTVLTIPPGSKRASGRNLFPVRSLVSWAPYAIEWSRVHQMRREKRRMEQTDREKGIKMDPLREGSFFVERGRRNGATPRKPINTETNAFTRPVFVFCMWHAFRVLTHCCTLISRPIGSLIL